MKNCFELRLLIPAAIEITAAMAAVFVDKTVVLFVFFLKKYLKKTKHLAPGCYLVLSQVLQVSQMSFIV